MTQDEIAKLKDYLRQRMDRERAEFERDLLERYAPKFKAVDLVQEIASEIDPTMLTASQPRTPNTAPADADSGVPDISESPTATGFLVPIEDVIARIVKDKSGWTAPQIHKGLGLPDSQRGTVWNAVQRLVELKKVRVVVPGAGRRAAQYGWIEDDENAKLDDNDVTD